MWAASYIVNFVRSVVKRRQMRGSSPLPKALQAEIIRAYRRMGGPIANNPVDLLGYKVSFLGENQLRYLFDEIFIRASYYFQAEVAQPIIFDCGSNIGMSILFFKKLYPNAHIVAFEPDPFTFEILSQNVKQNNLSNIVLHQIALSNRTTTVELYRDASPNCSSLRMSTMRDRHSGPGVDVPARRLSEFISSEVDLLKLDIEGAEGIVMTELVNSGLLSRVKRLHLEYHHHIEASADKLSQILELVEENGFGYQLRTDTALWPVEQSFQDVSIYCYRK